MREDVRKRLNSMGDDDQLNYLKNQISDRDRRI